MPNKGQHGRGHAAAAAGGGKSSTSTTKVEKASDPKRKGGLPAVSRGHTAEGEPVKKPDTRTLIAGSSWTGKLPVNLLSEHCQKVKWEKPDYSMKRVKDGFLSSVTLRSVHPKTKETTEVLIELPSAHQDIRAKQTAVEARHLAATWALFRISSMKNIHMMLPPDFRDLWKGAFRDIKAEDVLQGKAWLYSDDPFAAQEENERAKAAEIKKKQEIMEKKAAAVGPTLQAGYRHSSHGWASAPQLDMGKAHRGEVEAVLRRYALWTAREESVPSTTRQAIAQDLAKAGFRTSHVEEALDYCRDRQETLEWLLIHVPEDDLPQWALPENYSVGLSFVSGNVARETMISRLSQAGYSKNLCYEVLNEKNGNESEAAEALQEALCRDIMGERKPYDHLDEVAWSEELDTLDAVYGERFKKISASSCSIDLKIDGKDYCLNFLRSRSYPQEPPVLSLTADLPAYVKLNVYRRAVQKAIEAFLGQSMIFLIIDWLEAELSHIAENPGKLSDIAAVGNSAAEQKMSIVRLPTPKSAQPFTPVRKNNSSPASLSMLQRWRQKQGTESQVKMLQARRSLPAWKMKERIIQVVDEYQVTVISGPTGSGKSTQSVQFILDDMIQKEHGTAANIVCTQPRRISAISLAERVSEERCEFLGEEVGYVIRGESRQTHGKSRIIFCTTGVLLRRLQSSSGYAGAPLADVTHVVVDEVHERSLDTDFLLILLKQILPHRKDLKVILMSATINVVEFQEYFNSIGPVGTVDIEGRTFPVTDHYLDDVLNLSNFRGAQQFDPASGNIGKMIQSIGIGINYDLIAATVEAIHYELGMQTGSILIFLPGVVEINRTVDLLRRISNIYPLPLHASLTSAEQRRVFLDGPKGQRKVIAATNVAETSITVADCVAVIDTGKAKETMYDPERSMVRLQEVFASHAACKQRRGRAGRVRPGDCYKLYTRAAEAKMRSQPEPEIRRVSLEQLCLSIKAVGAKDVQGFLAQALTAPETSAIAAALELLRKMGALNIEGDLTALGRHLADMPADLRCGKLMIYGVLFGCLESCLTVAAILTVGSPFVSPQAKREESKAAKSSFAQGHGDLVADLEAYRQWETQRQDDHRSSVFLWCSQNFLSHQKLQDISSNRMQYLSSLREAGFIPSAYRFSLGSRSTSSYEWLNANSFNLALLRGLIAGAFNPQIARIAFPDKKYAASSSGAIELDPEARTIKYFTQDVGRVFVHPGSTLFDAQSFPGNSKFMAYFHRMETSKIFVRDLTPFNAYSLLMFAGSIELDTSGRGLIVDGWVRLRGWARIGALLGRLRALLDEVLAESVSTPGEMSQKGKDLTKVVAGLIEFDGYDR